MLNQCVYSVVSFQCKCRAEIIFIIPLVTVCYYTQEASIHETKKKEGDWTLSCERNGKQYRESIRNLRRECGKLSEMRGKGRFENCVGRVGSDHDGKLCVPNFREGKDDYATKEIKTCDLPIQTEPTKEKLTQDPRICIHAVCGIHVSQKNACTSVNTNEITMFIHHDMIVSHVRDGGHCDHHVGWVRGRESKVAPDGAKVKELPEREELRRAPCNPTSRWVMSFSHAKPCSCVVVGGGGNSSPGRDHCVICRTCATKYSTLHWEN